MELGIKTFFLITMTIQASLLLGLDLFKELKLLAASFVIFVCKYHKLYFKIKTKSIEPKYINETSEKTKYKEIKRLFWDKIAKSYAKVV